MLAQWFLLIEWASCDLDERNMFSWGIEMTSADLDLQEHLTNKPVLQIQTDFISQTDIQMKIKTISAKRN